MKLAHDARLDAIAGEYLLGTLQGAARRRFERAIRDEPLVALRVARLQAIFALRYKEVPLTQPSPQTWTRLERELDLGRYRTPWFRRLGVWRGFAVASTAALVLTVAVQVIRPASEEPASAVAIALLEGKTESARVTAALAPDRRTLELKASRPVVAGPQQSYELWLLPEEGGAPISLAVLGSLDARFRLPEAQVARVRSGAKLAVSVEPAGGSPTGAPTGPVILVGPIAI